MGGQLEYDTGPQFEDDDEVSRTETDRGGLLDADWKIGLTAGGGTFVVLYAIMYQIARTLLAAGFPGSPEMQPSGRVLAGLVMLSNHGATIEADGEPIETFSFGFSGVFSTHVSALVPIVVLVAAGYLLVRTLAGESPRTTIRSALRAGGAFLAGYVALSILLASISSWTPEEEESGEPGAAAGADDPETIAVAVDSSLVISVAGTVVTFLALGGLLALYVTFVYRPSEDENDAASDDAADDPGPNPEAATAERDDPRPDDVEPTTGRSSPPDSNAYSPRDGSAAPDRRYGSSNRRDPEERYGPDSRED